MTDPKPNKNTLQIIAEYIQALIGAVLLAVLIRSFVFEPFKIPSESMVPTLLVGDHIFVERYKYGLRLPFIKYWIAEFDDPKRGDVIVFSYPEDEDLDFIKRVVGVPGDVVAMRGGIMYVNNKKLDLQSFSPEARNPDDKCRMTLAEESDKIFPEAMRDFPYFLKYEKFNQSLETFPDGGVTHMLQYSKDESQSYDFEIKVPERSYFVMGDNRDMSRDSRFWGMVPRENLKGKAVYIWLSLDHEKNHCAHNLWSPGIVPNVRWDRFGREII